MDVSSTDKQIFEFSSMARPSEFRAAIYIVKCFRLKVIAEHVDHRHSIIYEILQQSFEFITRNYSFTKP